MEAKITARIWRFRCWRSVYTGVVFDGLVFPKSLDTVVRHIFWSDSKEFERGAIFEKLRTPSQARG